MKIGFDNDKYLKEQTQAIIDRVSEYNGKLYLECGGKLLGDYHASRVLPGFDADVKMRVFSSLKKKIEIIICIHSQDIEKRKIRSDYGISYDADVFKMIEDFNSWGLRVSSVLITRFESHPSILNFMRKLELRDINVYTHKATPGYPFEIDTIVSEEGFGANPYIPTSSEIVIVTGPGPGSGKMATCLSQLYHDFKRGVNSGYAKFETFPIWNLSLSHPVNIAYEAATADIGDFNLIDHFHLEAYKEKVVSYNRDMDCYPLLKRIIEKITNKESVYKSPTDMGVNRCGYGIIDDEIVRSAATQEIIRRYFVSKCEYIEGLGSKTAVNRIKTIMDNMGLNVYMRPVVKPTEEALQLAIEKGKGKDGIVCAATLELDDGKIITGANTRMLHASSALIINAIKYLSNIPSEIDLIPSTTIDSIKDMKKSILGRKEVSLDVGEVLICLAISSNINPSVKSAIEKLALLKGTHCHQSHIPSPGDIDGLRKLGIIVTSEARFASLSN